MNFSIFISAIISGSTTGQTDLWSPISPFTPPAPIRLVSPATHKLYMSFWPKSNSPVLAKLKSSGIIFYDDTVIPQAYQDWNTLDIHGRRVWGVHSPRYNISALKDPIFARSLTPPRPIEPYGNANMEFPWGMDQPAGLHEAHCNFKAIRFLILPSSDSIVEPIRWHREHLPLDSPESNGTFIWEYPTGTTFGEILLVCHSPEPFPGDTEKYDRPFELRTRTKTAKGKWTVNVWRPFASLRDLSDKLGSAPSNGTDMKALRMQDHHPDKKAFKSDAVMLELPAFPTHVINKLLDEPFVSVLGSEWASFSPSGNVGYAPTTKAAYHIVPRNYRGAFVPVDSESCMRCHESTLDHAKSFDQNRDWYGRIRGSDNIFTFHIFDKSSISEDGNPLPVRFNPALAPILARRPIRDIPDRPPMIIESRSGPGIE